MEPARRWHSLFRIEAFSARNPLGIESDFRSSLASTNNMAEFFKKCIECGERGVASVSYSLFDINGTLQRSEYEFGPETSDAGCAERNSHARTHQGETRDYIVRFMDGVQKHAVAPQHSRDRVVKTGSHTPGKNYNLLLVQRSRRDLFEARECMTSWHRQREVWRYRWNAARRDICPETRCNHQILRRHQRACVSRNRRYTEKYEVGTQSGFFRGSSQRPRGLDEANAGHGTGGLAIPFGEP